MPPVVQYSAVALAGNPKLGASRRGGGNWELPLTLHPLDTFRSLYPETGQLVPDLFFSVAV